MCIRQRRMSGRGMLENAVFSGISAYLIFCKTIVNYRILTSFIAKMGYEWGTIYIKMGYEN